MHETELKGSETEANAQGAPAAVTQRQPWYDAKCSVHMLRDLSGSCFIADNNIDPRAAYRLDESISPPQQLQKNLKFVGARLLLPENSLHDFVCFGPHAEMVSLACSVPCQMTNRSQMATWPDDNASRIGQSGTFLP